MSTGTFDRESSIDRLENTQFDVVVIGGGITGAGVALDAAARGLRTALVERTDFAWGTSSRSSKLVHGGLRYLQQGDVALVYQALAERQRLRHNAPHLVRILPFLLPVFTRDGLFNRRLAWALGKAMWMYDLTGGARIGKLHKRLSTEEAVQYMPTLPADRLAGAYLYYDATTDDARLTLAVARTAALDFGAVVVNQAEVTGFLHRDDGQLSGVVVDVGHHPDRDRHDGARFRDATNEKPGESRSIEVRAEVLVSATGVWADQVRGLGLDEAPDTIRPAKGIHITVPWELVRNEVAAVVPVPGDRRSVFVVPWGDQTYIGTTDTDYDGPLDDPRCTPDDIAYLLRAINGAIAETSGREITEADITGMWAGLRPLVRAASDGASSTGRTADLSRQHRVTVDDDGLVTIAGGKLTTYREMAADTVDQVVARLSERARGRIERRSPTKKLRLRGAAGFDRIHRQGAAAAGTSGLTDDQVRHLAERYGGEARVLFAMVETTPELGKPLVEGHPYLRAEVVYAARYEMAMTIDDVLARRVPLRLRDSRAALEVASEVATLIADDLGWDQARSDLEVEAFRRAVEQDRQEAKR